MPLGDSITAGSDDGCRKPLTAWLTGGHDTGREAIRPTIVTLKAGIDQTWAAADGVAEAQELGVNHRVIAFDRWIRDAYAPFILPDGSLRGWNNDEPQKTQGPAGHADYDLHPNTFGYGLIAEAWARAIEAHVYK